MKFGQILLNSFKYPFIDLKGLLYFCLLFVLSVIFNLGIYFENEYVMILGIITLIIFYFILPGYLLSVVKNGCNELSEIPKINVIKSFVDTFQLIILSIVYQIIPTLVFLILLMSLGVHFVTGFINSPINGLNVLLLHFGVILFVSLVVFFIFEILRYIATARLAYFDSLTEALSFKKVFSDLKQIGILKTIGVAFIVILLLCAIHSVSLLLFTIPYVGFLIYSCIIIPIISLIYSYSLGLLYSNVQGDIFGDDFDDEDLKQFEKEIEYLKYGRINLK